MSSSRFSRYLTHRNRLWLIARNEPLPRLLTALPEVLAHEALMFLRMLRYPYLWKATFEAFSGLRWAVGCRRKLPDKSMERPPFQRGMGFN